MRKGRILAGVAGVIVALAVAVGLAGCGMSAEDAVKKTIEDEVSAIKSITSMDSEAGQEYFNDDDGILTGTGISGTDIISAFFKHYEYKIEAVEVSDDGTSATATVEVTNANMQTIVTNVLNNNLGSLLAYSMSGDTAGMQKALLQALLDGLNADDAATVTNTVEIQYEKDDDGTWEPVDSDTLFNQLVMGGQDITVSM